MDDLRGGRRGIRFLRISDGSMAFESIQDVVELLSVQH